MGKKARKTRWRTLSIGEGPSDSESQAGDGVKPRGRWGPTGTTQSRYNSSQSTPTRYHNHRHYGGDSGTKWGPGGRALHASASTRSSSTTSENKITFNEDEYTKITTPRQDVLFKKGYLSKPKPHLQRPLTSAGNSTGDGTPDHQSADGADYPENEFDTVFPYPPGAYDPSLYYLNTFDPVGPNTVQPVLLYDQFGNTAFCYPHTGLHPTYQPHNNTGTRGAKRYSVDSLTESPSPNNETTCSAETETEEVEEIFEGAQHTSDTKSSESGGESDNEEKKLRKKRRRRKSEEIDSEEASDEVKIKYSVDAEEFIPRGFAPGPPQLGFVPLLPHEVFPGGFVLLPAPPQFYPAPPPPLEVEDEPAGPVGPIDIAKIVSKLEQAAREQTQEDKIQTEENETKPDIETVLPTETEEKETKITKTEVAIHPVAARYADRLKTQQTPIKKITHATVPQKQRITPKTRVCPRLERTATVLKPSPTPPTPTPTVTSDWISVSGKKKRKSNQKQIEIISSVSETPPVETTPLEILATPLITSPTVPEVPEVQEVLVETTNIEEKTPKSKEKIIKINSTKKQSKKRIIITDGALQGAPTTPNSSQTVVVPVEQATNCNLGENDQITKNKEPEVPEVVAQVQLIPEITPVLVTPEVPKQPEPTTKKQKKKNKNKLKLITSNTDLGAPGAESPTCEINTESSGAPRAPGAHQDDDMSLELDRMIQRGLYANLEQKLQNFNPGDSFLATLGRSAPITTPNLFSKPSPTLLSFPPLIIPPQTTSPPITDTQTSSTPSGGPIIGLSGPPGPPQGLSITQAVREWMDRTREATPEVEIFRRPQELREEVLHAIEDLEIGSEEEEDREEEAEDEKVDRTALDAASLLDERPRSRSGSVDLLQCWEYDVPVPAQHMAPVEAAEDALESYESVYGQSEGMQRILGQRTRPRGDGGLPYRAICCTVM